MNSPVILIVEDDDELLNVFKVRIESLGYQVLTAQKGDEALRLAREKLPSLIILDIFLPDMDGLTMLKRIKAPIDLQTGRTSMTKDILFAFLNRGSMSAVSMLTSPESVLNSMKPRLILAVYQTI